MRYIADVLTIGNLISGCVSLGVLLRGDVIGASWLVLFSVLLDGLDGYFARKFKTAGEFGKNLDSFADLISFGVAPACLAYVFLCGNGCHLGSVFAVLVGFAVCAAFRLARYNIAHQDGLPYSFTGVPTTECGGAVSSLVIYLSFTGVEVRHSVFLFFMGVLTILMVSTVKYPNLRGIRKTVMANKALAVIFAVLLCSATALIPQTMPERAGFFLSGLFLSYIVIFPFLKKNFV